MTPDAPRSRPSPLAWLLRGLVHAYRLAVSPFLPPSCRFWPTCSAYALEALEVHGALKGSWLAAARVCRCHPWHEGGVDPVPPRSDSSSSSLIPAVARASGPAPSPRPDDHG